MKQKEDLGEREVLLKKLINFIDSILEELASEELEKAADKYESEQQEKHKDRDNHDFDNYRDGFVDGLTHVYDAFKAGAQWQKEQITQDVAKRYFPELTESEDEKTRKWIYGIIKNIIWSADEDSEKELEKMQPLALAWLEKQAERKPIEWSEEDERIRLDTIELLEKAHHPSAPHINGKALDFTENINWLKSLPQTFIL